MKRALALAMLVVGAAALSTMLAVGPASATLDDDVFTSREADVRMLAPRGWRVSEQPSYPGVLLWMVRTKPPGQMMLTVEDIGPASRACWPSECGHDATVPDFVCTLSSRLKSAGFTIGPVEDGRWFDYQRGKDATRFMRQGVVVLGHHAFTLILSSPTANDRASHARAFDRALRSVRPLSAASDDTDVAGDDSSGADDGGVAAAGAPADGATSGGPNGAATGSGVVAAGAPPDGATASAAVDARPGASSTSAARGGTTKKPSSSTSTKVDGGASDGAASGTTDTAADGGSPVTDGGAPATDGGAVTPAVAPVDAGAPRPDAGVPVVEEVPPCRAPTSAKP